MAPDQHCGSFSKSSEKYQFSELPFQNSFADRFMRAVLK
jgi:hypothetical protein